MVSVYTRHLFSGKLKIKKKDVMVYSLFVLIVKPKEKKAKDMASGNE